MPVLEGTNGPPFFFRGAIPVPPFWRLPSDKISASPLPGHEAEGLEPLAGQEPELAEASEASSGLHGLGGVGRRESWQRLTDDAEQKWVWVKIQPPGFHLGYLFVTHSQVGYEMSHGGLETVIYPGSMLPQTFSSAWVEKDTPRLVVM